jgi:hypothetical protein
MSGYVTKGYRNAAQGTCIMPSVTFPTVITTKAAEYEIEIDVFADIDTRDPECTHVTGLDFTRNGKALPKRVLAQITARDTDDIIDLMIEGHANW